MAELTFKELYRFKKNREGEVKKLPWRMPDMFYSMWTDEIHLNEFFPCEEYDRRYPFHSQMLEDDSEAILSHEALHQVLRNTAGWKAAKWFDRICPHWAMRYWTDPP